MKNRSVIAIVSVTVLTLGIGCLLLHRPTGYRPGGASAQADTPETPVQSTSAPVPKDNDGPLERPTSIALIPEALPAVLPPEQQDSPPVSTANLSPTAEELLGDAVRSLGLDEAAVAGLRQAVSDVVAAGRHWARAVRAVTEAHEFNARVFVFPADPAAAADLRARFATAFASYLPHDQAQAALGAWEQAAEMDPSLDAFQHHRTIAIVPSDEGSGWQVLDHTFTDTGDLVAAHTVCLGLAEDDRLVWPDEYSTLLSE